MKNGLRILKIALIVGLAFVFCSCSNDIVDPVKTLPSPQGENQANSLSPDEFDQINHALKPQIDPRFAENVKILRDSLCPSVSLAYSDDQLRRYSKEMFVERGISVISEAKIVDRKEGTLSARITLKSITYPDLETSTQIVHFDTSLPAWKYCEPPETPSN